MGRIWQQNKIHQIQALAGPKGLQNTHPQAFGAWFLSKVVASQSLACVGLSCRKKCCCHIEHSGLHLRIWQALLVKLWSKCSAGPGISFPTILHKHLPQHKLEFSSLAMSGRSKHVTSWPIGEWHTGQGQVQLVPAWSASGACLQDFKAFEA